MIPFIKIIYKLLKIKGKKQLFLTGEDISLDLEGFYLYNNKMILAVVPARGVVKEYQKKFKK